METKVQYEKSIMKILGVLEKLNRNEIRIRFINRQKEKLNDEAKVIFSIEEMEIEDNIKDRVIDVLKGEFNRMKDEEINIHTNYKMSEKIMHGSVGILDEDSYPQELKDLISCLQNPAPKAKSQTIKKAFKEGTLPVAFAVSFEGVTYIKKIAQKKIASAKKKKYTFVVGTKHNKIISVDEDYLLITLYEPDMVIYTMENGYDPTFVYNSHHFSTILATLDTIRKILMQSHIYQKILSDPEPLFDYLNKAWQSVYPLYFKMKQEGFDHLDKKYVSILNTKFFKNKLVLDKDGKLESSHLNGDEIYNILMNKYGIKYNEEGNEEKGVIEDFHVTMS